MKICARGYDDVLTRDVLGALHALAPLDDQRLAVMQARLDRRTARGREQKRIGFLDPASTIEGTSICRWTCLQNRK